ncbi:Glycosyltransferase involved in cell wall bisynthesis [Algibacter lectus]|uniref:glycosyltransferase n=1 Tax=Algibacter lectus TaxID=221126 RepID=UPI0008EE3F29|nr:glycosyltransferase [Algibacter lectus]SFD29875.1 Glycosyltransferase involved in cell wall bisynthesis [Algibacter lectus]
MKINHVITSIDISTGGPARSVTHLISEMLSLESNIKIDLETLKSPEPILNSFNTPNGNVYFHDFEKLGLSKSLKNSLKKSEAHLLHGHGLWQMPVHQMAKMARERHIPYIITPRGMLEPWSLTQSPLKKKLALSLFQKKDLDHAACIHATAPMEVKSIRDLGFTNPVAMIPNGIDLKAFSDTIPNKSKTPKRILFLSRIHKKKGIENLIEAWKQLNPEVKQNWVIDIYGNGDTAYIEELKTLIKKSNLENQIQIKAPVFGEEKLKVFRAASLFVLPTFSENFGIVVAEALACYTPVITTKGAPWEALETYNCGNWIDIGVKPLVESLNQMLVKSPEALLELGINGRKLVEDQFSMNAVAKQMLELYNWILNDGDKPKYVDVV